MFSIQAEQDDTSPCSTQAQCFCSQCGRYCMRNPEPAHKRHRQIDQVDDTGRRIGRHNEARGADSIVAKETGAEPPIMPNILATSPAVTETPAIVMPIAVNTDTMISPNATAVTHLAKRYAIGGIGARALRVRATPQRARSQGRRRCRTAPHQQGRSYGIAAQHIFSDRDVAALRMPIGDTEDEIEHHPESR